MIDEGRTLEIYGYTSDELAPHSCKPIVAVCEECGTYRVLAKQSYSELCRACSHITTPVGAICSVCGEVGVYAKGFCEKCYKKQYFENLSPEQIEKHNARSRKENRTPEQIEARNACRRKENLTSEQIEKKNASMLQRYEDNREVNCITVRGSEEHSIKLSCTRRGISIDEWDGFAVEAKYCPKFNNACRERNREKYDRRCFICNKTEAENGKRLSVHHVDMEKQQGCDGHVWRLVPVCTSHHKHDETTRARIEYLLDNVW